MTEDEEIRIKGEVATRLAKKRSQRACLVSKAEKVRAELDKASALLRPMIPRHRIDANRSEPQPEDWPSCQGIREIVEEFRQTEEEIASLEGRLRDWGVLSG